MCGNIMNKAISWKKDEHFSGEGKEYNCTDTYAKYESYGRCY